VATKIEAPREGDGRVWGRCPALSTEKNILYLKMVTFNKFWSYFDQFSCTFSRLKAVRLD